MRPEETVERVLRDVHGYLEGRRLEDVADVFAAAAVMHAAQLLRAELVLYLQGQYQSLRLLGRAIYEYYLYSFYCSRGREAGVDLIMAEDQASEHRLARGRNGARELDAEIRAMLREEPPKQADSAKYREPNLLDLARRLDNLGTAANSTAPPRHQVRYQLDYRWDSARHVHAGLAVFARYMTLEPPPVTMTGRYVASQEELRSLAEDLLADATLVLEALAEHLMATGRTAEHAQLWERWKNLVEEGRVQSADSPDPAETES